MTLHSWDLVIYRLLVSVAGFFFMFVFFFSSLREILIWAQHFANIYPSEFSWQAVRVSKGKGKSGPGIRLDFESRSLVRPHGAGARLQHPYVIHQKINK